MRLAIHLTIRLLAAAMLGASALAPLASAADLAPPPKVTSPRLYVFDCGTLVYNKPEDYNLKREEVKDSNMGVTCYLVVHPKGMLMYDTGLNDRLVGRPLYENVLEGYAQIKFNTLSGQLADIGVAPANIDYLVLSHYHWDHIGNAGDFAGSTWLVYKGDRDQMFSKRGTRLCLVQPVFGAGEQQDACFSAATMTSSGTVPWSCSRRRDIRRGTARCWCA